MAPLLDPDHPVDAHAQARLAAEPVIWLATSTPHAVPVWFHWADPVVTVFSRPGTAKTGQLRRDPAVALHLDTASHGTDVVILEGTASVDLVDTGAEERFAAKYAPMLAGQAFADWRATFSLALTVVVGKVIAWRAGADGLEYRSVR